MLLTSMAWNGDQCRDRASLVHHSNSRLPGTHRLGPCSSRSEVDIDRSMWNKSACRASQRRTQRLSLVEMGMVSANRTLHTYLASYQHVLVPPAALVQGRVGVTISD